MAHQVNENQSWDSQHNPQVPHPDFLLKAIRHNGRICWSWKSFEAGNTRVWEKGIGVRPVCSRISDWGKKNRVRQPLLLPKGEFKIPTGSRSGKPYQLQKKAKDQPS